MRPLLLPLALLVGFAGCKNVCNRPGIECAGAADACATAESTTRCPTPRVETQAPEEIEVRVPRQKVVVEMPAAACKPPAPAAPCCQTFPTMPQYAPQMMSMPGYNQAMMAPMAAPAPAPARMGLMFDTMRIPIPILRPIAVPRPAEMTMTMPMAPAMMMPMMPAMGMGMGTGMAPQNPVGMGQMTLQGQMTAQQATALMAAAQGQAPPTQMNLLLQMAGAGQLTPQQIAQIQAILSGTPAAPAAPPAPPAPPTSAAPTAPVSTVSLREQVRLAEQRLKELEELRRKEQP